MKSHRYLQSAPEQITHDIVTKNELFYKLLADLLVYKCTIP